MVTKRNPQAHYRVFISHCHQDRWIAKQCVRLIEEGGAGRIQAFLDEKDIQGGQSIAGSIRTSIQGCDEFVVLLSPYSKDRPWVLIEVGAAWGLGKPIIAIVDKVGPKELPDIMNLNKALSLNDFDQYLSQFMQRVRAKKRKK